MKQENATNDGDNFGLQLQTLAKQMEQQTEKIAKLDAFGRTTQRLLITTLIVLGIAIIDSFIPTPLTIRTLITGFAFALACTAIYRTWVLHKIIRGK